MKTQKQVFRTDIKVLIYNFATLHINTKTHLVKKLIHGFWNTLWFWYMLLIYALLNLNDLPPFTSLFISTTIKSQLNTGNGHPVYGWRLISDRFRVTPRMQQRRLPSLPAFRSFFIGTYGKINLHVSILEDTSVIDRHIFVVCLMQLWT